MKKAQMLSKVELIHQIAAQSGQSLAVTEAVLAAFERTVHDNLAQGISVRLFGFGTWEIRQWPERHITSIQDGTLLTLPKRAYIAFSVGEVLARAVDPKKKRKRKAVEK